jgi:hypothetical protein
MFDPGYELVMWQIYNDWQRQAEKNRLVHQAWAGEGRGFRPFAWVRAWLRRHQAAPQRQSLGHLHASVKEATTGSRTSGGLIL